MAEWVRRSARMEARGEKRRIEFRFQKGAKSKEVTVERDGGPGGIVKADYIAADELMGIES